MLMKKRIIALLLCLTVALAFVPVAFAEPAEEPAPDTLGIQSQLQNEDAPIVFVTGIGQTHSYVLDDKGGNTLEYNGQEYRYSERKNLFIWDTKAVLTHIFTNPVSLFNTLATAAQLIGSLATGQFLLRSSNLHRLAADLLYLNIVDENCKLPENVLTPIYNYPLSEYSEYELDRFYGTVPAKEQLEEYGNEKVFVYNFAPFGSMTDTVAGLNTFINDVVQKYYPDQKVILMPMSMGASVVRNYLANYGRERDVKKVVSIVGCWNGSKIFTDLVEQRYADNSAEMFYTEMFSGLIGSPTGDIIEILLHLYKKEFLTRLVNELLIAVCDEFVMKTPTMMAMIPSDDYPRIRERYLTKPGYERVLLEADRNYQSQLELTDTLKKLNEEQGIEFYFISAYNLKFGEITGDYNIFKFLYSAARVNSDEIIHIESTTVGATSVPAGYQFPQSYIDACKTPEYIDPTKSVDLSTAAFPNHCWLFSKQKHELEWNNTALKLAFALAKGEVTDVADCPDVFPQFNEGRNLKDLRRDYLPQMEEFIDKYDGSGQYAEQVAKACDYITKAQAMMDCTINNIEKDDALMNEIAAFCHELYVLENGEEPEEKPSKITPVIQDINHKIYGVFGTGGFLEKLFG